MHRLYHTLRLALVGCVLWGNSLVASAGLKATTPPPLRTTTAEWYASQYDTLAYLYGVLFGQALHEGYEPMNIAEEHRPAVVAGVRQYGRERSDARRLAYNTGIMLVPDIVQMLAQAQAHAFGQDTTMLLSLPHFAQGIEEAMQGADNTPVPEDELEQWTDGQLSNLKHNYSVERAEQVSLALGRVALRAGYISRQLENMGADSLYLSDATNGIAQGLRATQPEHIAHYTGLHLGHVAWKSYDELCKMLDHPLPIARYLEGMDDEVKGTANAQILGGARTMPEVYDVFNKRVMALQRHRYEEAMLQATHYWDDLRQDTTLVWHTDRIAYRIEQSGQGAKPTPNQRIKGQVTTLDRQGRAIAQEADEQATAWSKALAGSGVRLRSLPEPLRGVLTALPTGTSITLYHNQIGDQHFAEEPLALLPKLIHLYSISTEPTTATSAKKPTTIRRATTTKRKTATRRRR